jgi:hypothetical protein
MDSIGEVLLVVLGFGGVLAFAALQVVASIL